MLERIAEKMVEPMSADADPNKQIGTWRNELRELLLDVVDYVGEQRRTVRSNQSLNPQEKA